MAFHPFHLCTREVLITSSSYVLQTCQQRSTWSPIETPINVISNTQSEHWPRPKRKKSIQGWKVAQFSFVVEGKVFNKEIFADERVTHSSKVNSQCLFSSRLREYFLLGNIVASVCTMWGWEGSWLYPCLPFVRPHIREMLAWIQISTHTHNLHNTESLDYDTLNRL